MDFDTANETIQTQCEDRRAGLLEIEIEEQNKESLKRVKR